MSETAGPGKKLPARLARRLNETCRRFETAWLSGRERPRIEDHLADWPEGLRPAALRELIAVEWELRRRAGECPGPALYQGRFPGHEELIAALFQETEADPPQNLPPAAVPERLGAYRLVREIGRGGMGIVYEAVHEGLGRRVALKVLRTNPFWQAQQAERFRREARTVASLHHPHVVTLYEAGEQDGVYFLAMQMVEGRSLSQVLAAFRSPSEQPTGSRSDTQILGRKPKGAGGPLPDPYSPDYPRAVARVGLQVAQALQHAHERGVLHRDVKPSNLLLDGEGGAWVTDFGLARIEGDLSLTGSDQVLGTPRYLAPEALEGAWLPASDVYSLGLTLYEMLTLRPAFSAPNAFLLLDQVLRGSPPRPREINPLVPPALEAIILRATARKREKRHASAAELARDLKAFLEEPRQAAPRPRRKSLAVVGLVLLCLGSAFFLWRGFHAPAPGGGREEVSSVEKPCEGPFPGLLPRPALLPDGRRWQVETIRSRVHQMALAWTPDSRWLACGDDNGRIRVLEAEGDRLVLRRLFLGHTHLVYDLAWSRDGRLASASYDRTVRVWGPDGRPSRVLRWEGFALSLAWSPDGKSLLTGGNDGTVRVWDLDTGRDRTLHSFGTTDVRLLGWSADGLYQAAGVGQKVHVWSADGAEKVFDHGHTLVSLAWAPRACQLATSGKDGRVRLWDPEAREPLAVLDVPASLLAWHPDGDRLAVVAPNMDEVHAWSAAGKHLGKLLEARAIKSLGWSPDGRSLGVGCLGGRVVVRWAGGERELAPLLPAVQVVGVTRGTGLLVSGAPLAAWADDGTSVRRFPGAKEAGWPSWGGKYLAAWDARTRTVWLMTPEGSVVRRFPSAGRGTLSRDDRLAVQSEDRREFRVWNPDGSAGPSIPAGPRGEWTSGLAWDGSGRKLAITALGLLRVWDVAGGGLQTAVSEADLRGVGAPAWSPDGKWLAAGSGSHILLHDSGGVPQRSWMAGHAVQSLGWSDDSRWLASVGADRVLRLWRPSGEAGPSLAVGTVPGLCWKRDGRLALAEEDGRLTVLEVRDGELRALWVGLLVGDGAVCFDSAGKVLLGDEKTLSEQFVFVVEGPGGEQELLPATEFRRLRRNEGQ